LKKGLRKHKDKLQSQAAPEAASEESSDDGAGSLLDPDNFLAKDKMNLPTELYSDDSNSENSA